MANEKKVVQDIIKRHGEVINLRQNPEVMIDILRRYRVYDDDGGLPGGVPPPPPPPGPSSFQDRLTLEEVMREVLKVSRGVAKLNQQIGAGAAAKKKK